MKRLRGGGDEKYSRQLNMNLGRCEPCGKAIFLSRKTAKAMAKRVPRQRGPFDDELSRPRCYPCPVNPDHWHIGHIPVAVRNGTITRDQWHESKENRTDG